MPLELRISEAAHDDLLEIWVHIARDNVRAADRWADKMHHALQRLCEFPNLGPSREEIAPGLRSFPIGRYLIFYRTAPDAIQIKRIVHGMRDLTELQIPD